MKTYRIVINLSTGGEDRPNWVADCIEQNVDRAFETYDLNIVEISPNERHRDELDGLPRCAICGKPRYICRGDQCEEAAR